MSLAVNETPNGAEGRPPLLPVRYPDPDLFICDVLDAIPKDDMASMEHPIFSLATKPDRRVFRYEHNGNVIEIIPSGKGLAEEMQLLQAHLLCRLGEDEETAAADAGDLASLARVEEARRGARRLARARVAPVARGAPAGVEAAEAVDADFAALAQAGCDDRLQRVQRPRGCAFADIGGCGNLAAQDVFADGRRNGGSFQAGCSSVKSAML